MTHSAEDFTLPSMTLVKTDTKLVLALAQQSSMTHSNFMKKTKTAIGEAGEMISVVLFSAAIVAVDPQYADNITVYHVNPHQYGAIPVNMVCLSK